ncbi:MAG: DUF4149 domain-containing protein [Actinomycetota bacterium]
MLTLLIYTWFGLVLGVSFLATPVKFRAPSLTRPVALDVGRTTFHAFGKVEWVLSVAVLVAAALDDRGLPALVGVGIGAVVVIVVLQAAWLIPRLDVRVAAVIEGQDPPPSHLHSIYAGAEAGKALILLAVGLWSAGTL